MTKITDCKICHWDEFVLNLDLSEKALKLARALRLERHFTKSGVVLFWLHTKDSELNLPELRAELEMEITVNYGQHTVIGIEIHDWVQDE